ncbi:DUF4160 domain-containing protein [Roseateles sp.]|uniref:DUF4160 domain-containing protein n=1 Tax=Roseateles sp. TaxID=1971397 RepID=UPI0031D1A40B
MPTIARLPKSQIRIFGKEHPPPHFHIRANDGSKAAVTIMTLRVLAGEIPQPALSEALQWAEANRLLLMRLWKENNP